MNVLPVTRVLHQLRTLGPNRYAVEVPDGELVERFARQKDEAAFAVLLRRHGPMVLRVCRGVLWHAQDAEDAFQATWIVLARKAASLRRGDAVAAWLHGVAHRVALKARAAAALRRLREGQTPARTSSDPLDEISMREAQAILDEELLRLPGRYQAPLLLCCLEGLTRDEAAARLGLPISTLKSRLEEGRLRLRRRLARRGLCLSAVLSPVALSAPASAAVPAHLFAAALCAGRGSAAPSALAQAALGSLARARLGLGALLALTAGLLAAGAALLPSPSTTVPGTSQPPPAPQVAPPPQTKKDIHGDLLPPDALMRLGTLRHALGYQFERVNDGRTLVTRRGEGLSWIDAGDGTEQRSWRLPPDHRFGGIAADGRRVLLLDKDTMSIWDTVKNERLCTLAPVATSPQDVFPPETPGWVQFAPDGSTLAGIGYGRATSQVSVWSAAGGKLLWQVPVATNDGWNDFRFGMKRRHHGSPHLRFLPDGKKLVLLHGHSHLFELRDCATGKVHASATLSVNADYSWTIASEGKTLLAVDPHDGLRAWTPGGGRKWAAVPLAEEEKASRLECTADHKTLLLAGNGKLRVRDWPSGKLRREIDLDGRSIEGILPGTAGRVALLCEGETAPRHFDLATGKETTAVHEGHRGIVSQFSLAADGKVVSAGYDGSLVVWDLTRGRAANAFRPKNGSIFTSVSADGKLVAAVGWKGTEVAVHERDSGRLVRIIATAQPLRYLAFAPRSRQLLTGEGIPATVFRVWDADTGREVHRLPGKVFGSPAFSPDGRLLATLGEESVRVLEFATGKELFSFVEKGAYALAFSPDGRTLACGSGKAIALWEVAAQKRRGRIELSRPDCTAVRFSADGRWLAWGENECIQIWDLLRNRPLHTFRGHEGNVTDLRFTPAGRTLISASTDSTLLVWDLEKLRNK